jgi:hypothetical protein
MRLWIWGDLLGGLSELAQPRIYGAGRVRTRMLRVGRRVMDGDRRVRILLLLDREAAPLAERPAGDEHLIRTTIDPDTDGSNSCHERTIHGNSLRLSGYASLALIRHWTIFLLLVHQ